MSYNNIDLYGLAPSDLTTDQIKKIPSNILWTYSSEDLRFENELVSRINCLEDVKKHIYYYDAIKIKSLPKLTTRINELIPNEISYNTIKPYFDVLTEQNKKNVISSFLTQIRNKDFNQDKYKELLHMLGYYYQYTNPDSQDLIDVIIYILKKPHTVNTYIIHDLLAHISKTNFLKNYQLIKSNVPNAVWGKLLYITANIPEEDHLSILKAMSKVSMGLNRSFKTNINPLLLKKLSLNARISILKKLSLFHIYPFTYKISINFIKDLIFPVMFKYPNEVNITLVNWQNIINNIMPADLPLCEFEWTM